MLTAIYLQKELLFKRKKGGELLLTLGINIKVKRRPDPLIL